MSDIELGECGHEWLDCPNHEGGYDCTPFCRICEGNQGYCPTCEPLLQTGTDLYEAINAVLDNAIFDEDSSGEIIIATGFRFAEDGVTLERVEK